MLAFHFKPSAKKTGIENKTLSNWRQPDLPRS
jgi:hypothetical protein